MCKQMLPFLRSLDRGVLSQATEEKLTQFLTLGRDRTEISRSEEEGRNEVICLSKNGIADGLKGARS